MDEKEFDALVAKVGQAAAQEIKVKMEEAQKALDAKLELISKGTASKEDLEKAEKASTEALEKANEKFLDILKAQGEAIGELKMTLNSKKDGKEVSFKDALKEAIEAPEFVAAVDSIVKNQGKQTAPLELKISKAAVVIGEGNTIGSGTTQYTLSQNTGIISGIRRRLERYLEAVSVGKIGNKYAIWIEETDSQGTPIFIAEGASKVQLSSIWVEKTANVKKIGVYSKVTTELMADLPQLLSFIQNTLLKRLSLATEDQLFSGDGTGDNLIGAFTLATAFSAGANAGEITAANEFDVLDAIALQVEVANGEANAVFINPATWSKMKGLKDLNQRPIWKDYVDPVTKDVVYAGMVIRTTTAVADDQFLGGDLTVLNVLYREEMSIQIGLDGNDFTKNLKTILAEQRLVQFASANDTPVIVKGDFTTAKAALTVI